MVEPDTREILRRIEERAARDAASRSAAEAEAEPDLLRELGGHGREGPDPDTTFLGYLETHERVPAFEGCDGQPYTVDIDTEATGDPARPWAAFLVFVRWAETGAGIMGHVTSGDVAHGATEDEARTAALELSLYRLKEELDRAILHRRELLEE
jgi:hypothetical protein